MSDVSLVLTQKEAELIHKFLKKRPYIASGMTPEEEALRTLEKALKEQTHEPNPNGTPKD